ncbi:hypothetical protein, partial [Bordetella hinzii]|uniref:hypothetical protein n=1 Tax=Bordetella hinzii TaxID=103855 RepID=UPI001E58101E
VRCVNSDKAKDFLKELTAFLDTSGKALSVNRKEFSCFARRFLYVEAWWKDIAFGIVAANQKPLINIILF